MEGKWEWCSTSCLNGKYGGSKGDDGFRHHLFNKRCTTANLLQVVIVEGSLNGVGLPQSIDWTLLKKIPGDWMEDRDTEWSDELRFTKLPQQLRQQQRRKVARWNLSYITATYGARTFLYSVKKAEEPLQLSHPSMVS